VTGEPLVRAEGVTRRFPNAHTALEDVSIAVGRGEFVALTGPSGGGKTTLLSLLGALDHPSAGRVLFDGSEVARLSASAQSRLRRRIGVVFQGSPMLARLPLWENVTYPLVPRGAAAGERRAIAARLLESLGLGDRIDSRPEELSGGERRRVGVARALAGEPDLLLADEPTSDLDPDHAAVVRAIFDDFRAGGGTVVMATHDPDRDARYARIVRLESGRVRPDSGSV
jgi:putative ABC transport system ATP-binding protein